MVDLTPGQVVMVQSYCNVTAANVEPFDAIGHFQEIAEQIYAEAMIFAGAWK